MTCGECGGRLAVWVGLDGSTVARCPQCDAGRAVLSAALAQLGVLKRCGKCGRAYLRTLRRGRPPAGDGNRCPACRGQKIAYLSPALSL